MASKSKKRRRVLGASCILAALIIAGSSFAWFTSKDEVTNRLTATSDYGVSIVESFIPPKMWTPGETIDKDVYAVNTGSIPAFVKETVSGKLALEYENTVNDFTTTNAVVLKEDEIKLSEAGGFLVWNNAGAANGAVGTDYAPTVSGDYIFRRSIEGDPTATQHPVFTIGNEKYTLEGFHYDSGENKYYKIVIDDYKTGKEDHNRTAVEVNADGTLKDTPNILYVISDKVEAQPVAFTYEAKDTANGIPNNRLVATYQLAPSAAVNYDPNATAAMHAVKVENAHGEYDFAKYREDVASAEFALLNSLIGERNTLAAAAKAATDALGSQSTANSALTDAFNAVDGKTVMTATLNTGDHEYADRVFTSSDDAYSGKAPSNGYQAYPQDLKDAIVAFEKLYGETLSGGTADGTIEKETALISAFTALKNAVTTDKADATNTVFTGTGGIDECIETLRSAYNTLDQYSENLYKAYFDLVAVTDTPTALAVANSMTAFKTALGTGAGSYMAVVDGWKTDVDNLITAVEAYKAAKVKSVSSDKTAGNKLKDFVDAVGTYDGNVEGDGKLMKTFLGATPAAGQTLYDLYMAFFGLNEKNHNGQMDYNGESNNTNPSGKKFQADLRTGGNTDYYIAGAINQDFTGFDKDNSSTWTFAQTLANTIVGYGLDKPEVTEDTFKIHLNNSDSTLTDLKASTTAQYNAWQKLLKNPAVTPANTDVKIYVNLDDVYASNWEMVLGADDLNNVLTPAANRQAVDFYYKKILEGGKTSEKLIDSVTLDESMQNVFKNLTFDLDIGLDSAQITYNEDQKTVDTTAVNGNAAFVLKPTLGGDKGVTAPVSWAEVTVADKVYKVGEDVVGKPTALGTPHTMKANASDPVDTAYGYQLTYMGETYYGLNATGDFFKDNSGFAGDKVTVTES